MRTGFWWVNLREGGHLEDEDAVGDVILKWIFKKEAWGTWAASICFRCSLVNVVINLQNHKMPRIP
jgi:hypothetical protein